MQIAKSKLRSIYLPLRTKFVILFCLLITIPFFVIGTITYQKYSANVERNTTALSYQIVDQIKINLDRYVKEMERLTLMPLYDDNVMQILKNHSGLIQHEIYLTTEETLKMNLFISSMTFDRSEVESILLFTNDGSIFSNLDQSIRKQWDPALTAPWMAPVKKADGSLTVIPPHEADYYVAPKKVVSIARVIREPYTNKMLGIVKVDLTRKGFETMLSSVSFSGDSILDITDKDGTTVYASAEIGQQQDDSWIRATAESEYTGMRVSALIPRDDLRRDAKELSQSTLFVSLIALLAAYLAAVVSANRLVRPIAHLQSKMRQVQRGLFKERAVVTSNDEIGQLTEGFNTMIGEIDRLVKEVYETRLREREAEISALQSQIHPHFLYNTLEMMNMLALQGNRQELSNTITSLGKLLRYTVDKKEQQVNLIDEIRFVEAYLNIQALRLGDRLLPEIHVDASYDRCLVPKLILQPIVENVIEHAMVGAEPVHMRIRANAEEDDLLLSIQDDGIGLTRERMDELETAWQQVASAAEHGGGATHPAGSFGTVKKGFALRNVHQRIRLQYGKPYGLSLDRKVQTGVRIIVRLPIQWGR